MFRRLQQSASRIARPGQGRAISLDPARAALFVEHTEAHTSGWFWQTDEEGRITYLSEKVAEVPAARGIETIGKPLTDVFKLDSASPETERTLAFHMASRTAFSGYSVRLTGSLSEAIWSMSGRPLIDDRGRFTGFVGSGSDLTERRRSEAEITRLALFDGLTGLANRQRMKLSLDQALAPQAGIQRPSALFLLDLDRFKAVNDTLGHQTGDDLLKQVGQRLLRTVGEAGLVGRLGGDEFQIVLPGMSDRSQLGTLARDIISSLSQPYLINETSISIGCSVGIALAPVDGGDSETLVRNADLALYAAKAEGRGIHRFYREEMLQGARNRRQLEDDLRVALAANQFRVAYQPIVSSTDERIVGYEALLRWIHPTRGHISPADFIPVAEECGLIEAIGEWVLRTACMEAAKWPSGVRVAVNVSAIQFANPALPGIVTSALARAGIAPGRLEIELTEGIFLHETDATERMFKALKTIGVRLALDDFGTGYSSLGYLKRAPFDKIKIDQSFVRGAAITGNRNAAIIRAIVSLAATLGMETTAEGVENLDEIELIRDLGCSHIQGYVYGKPCFADGVEAQLKEGDGVARPIGHRVSRSPRATVLRSATMKLGQVSGEVRIRNISRTGAMIDGIEFRDDNVRDIEVMIEVLENELVPARLRWARDGKAGIEFDREFDLERLNPGTLSLPR